MTDMMYTLNNLIGLFSNISVVLYQAIAAMTDWFFNLSGHFVSGVGSWLGF